MSIEEQDLTPIGTEEEFAAALATFVTGVAPRVFAIVQEYGPRVDARIAGWGLAHEDHVDVIGDGNDVHLGASSPEDMLSLFGGQDRITARIVWPGPTDAS
jgi:hypothetical protein